MTGADDLAAVRTRDIAYARWEAGDIEVRRQGDSAAIRYRSEMAFTIDGSPSP